MEGFEYNDLPLCTIPLCTMLLCIASSPRYFLVDRTRLFAEKEYVMLCLKIIIPSFDIRLARRGSYSAFYDSFTLCLKFRFQRRRL